jgi:hypothetical protein
MKRLLIVAFAILLCLGTVTAAGAQYPCMLGNQLPYPGSTFALGPLMYYALMSLGR